MKRKAFTLIELLVVIAIIGILAALILLSLRTARAKARDARRKSDLRQIKAALELYSSDNSENFPAAATNTNITTALTGLVPTYIKSLPTDPSGYVYYYVSSAAPAINYTLSARLENTGDADATKTCTPTKFDYGPDTASYCTSND